MLSFLTLGVCSSVFHQNKERRRGGEGEGREDKEQKYITPHSSTQVGELCVHEVRLDIHIWIKLNRCLLLTGLTLHATHSRRMTLILLKIARQMRIHQQTRIIAFKLLNSFLTGI